MTRFLQTLGIAAATLISTTHALATFIPLTSDSPAYKVGIPSGSTVSASSKGSIYFQISAPTSYRWVGFGIGEQMAGAKIFVVYADGKGNVTVSGRDGGQGHVQPQQDSGIQSGIELLEGSGIVGGLMVANFRCNSVTLDSAKDDSASPFIAAWSVGSALNSASTSATILQHNGNARQQITLDLSAAVITSDSNPFVAAADKPANSTDSGSSGSSGSGSGSSGDSGSSNSTQSSGSGSSSNGDSNGSASVVGTSGNTIATYEKAHGIIMGITVVLLFPLGAIYMRMGGSALIHGGLQIFSLCMLIIGFGLGVELGHVSNLLYNTTHTICGTVVFALFLIQPFLGIAHHLQYRRSQHRNPVSHLHIWYGRIILILGVVNGGLGLRLADNSKGGKIAYAVVSGVVGLLYIGLVVLKRKGNGQGLRGGNTAGYEMAVPGETKHALHSNGKQEQVRDGSS